jgi:hypothetical protein
MAMDQNLWKGHIQGMNIYSPAILMIGCQDFDPQIMKLDASIPSKKKTFLIKMPQKPQSSGSGGSVCILGVISTSCRVCYFKSPYWLNPEHLLKVSAILAQKKRIVKGPCKGPNYKGVL